MKKIYWIITIGIMLLVVGGTIAGLTGNTMTLPKEIKLALASIGLASYDKTEVQVGDTYISNLKQEDCWEEVYQNEWYNDTFTITKCRNILDTQIISTNQTMLNRLEEQRLIDIGKGIIDKSNEVVVDLGNSEVNIG